MMDRQHIIFDIIKALGEHFTKDQIVLMEDFEETY